MRPVFQVIDQQETRHGELVLRRRTVLSLGGREVWEVMLGGQLLMSSLVHDSERALANLALDELGSRARTVLVGGLGLGYTAREVLARPQVERLVVAELLPTIIGWHRLGLVPLGDELCGAARCELRQVDFFEMMAAPPPNGVLWDAILLDIDHSPRALLQDSPAAFYQRDGLARMAAHVAPGGVFALWSADPVEDAFLEELEAVFARVRTEEIRFDNPMLDREDHNTIYLARA